MSTSKTKDDKKAAAAALEKERMARERDEVVRAVQALLRGLQSLEAQVHKLEVERTPSRSWWGRRECSAPAAPAPSATEEAAKDVELLAAH